MASPSLVLPGVLFVGEDDRARIVAHTGPAAGWHVPRGILGWSTEVSVVDRDALTEEIRRSTKLVMPEEQIPPARMPLTAQAAQKSPLVAISSRLTAKLVESGVRVHTVGVDRVTSSFYYLAEGGGEEKVRIEGDLVQSVGAMLGERADNAAIERVLDGLPDRLLRALSKDRVNELTIELAAALPRAAADGSGTQEIDLDAFEKALSELVGGAEKYRSVAQEIANKLAETSDRRIELPMFGEARKVSQGPFDISVGDGRVSLPTYERWVMSTASGAEAVRASTAPAALAAPAAQATGPRKHDSQDSMLANLETGPSAASVQAAAQAKADAEAAVAENARKAAEAARAEAARAAEVARKAEEAKKAEAARVAAEARAAEDKRRAEEARAAEEARKAEETAKAAEEAARAAEEAARAAEAATAAAAAKAAEEARLAEEVKAAEAKAAADAAIAETKEAEAEAAEDNASEQAAKADAVKGGASKTDEPKKAKGRAAKKAEAKKAEAARAEAKKAEAKKADGAKAEPDRAKKDDAARAAAKSAAAETTTDDAKAAKTATDEKQRDTLKIKRADAVAKKSSSTVWIALIVLILAGVAVWQLFLKH